MTSHGELWDLMISLTQRAIDDGVPHTLWPPIPSDTDVYIAAVYVPSIQTYQSQWIFA